MRVRRTTGTALTALALASHCPALRVGRSRRRARSEPYILLHDLAAEVCAADRASWVRDLFEDAERILALEPNASQIIGYGLLEDIQNISSHRPTEEPAAWLSLLGPYTRELWHDVEELWGSVADELRAGEVPREALMNDSEFAEIDHPAVRAFMEVEFRRCPDGLYVSVADVLSYELRHRSQR